jgi:hypothetical protein
MDERGGQVRASQTLRRRFRGVLAQRMVKGVFKRLQRDWFRRRSVFAKSNSLELLAVSGWK